MPQDRAEGDQQENWGNAVKDRHAENVPFLECGGNQRAISLLNEPKRRKNLECGGLSCVVCSDALRGRNVDGSLLLFGATTCSIGEGLCFDIRFCNGWKNVPCSS